MRYGLKWPEYAKQWDRMTINKNRQQEFDHYARRLLANKSRYQAIQRRTATAANAPSHPEEVQRLLDEYYLTHPRTLDPDFDEGGVPWWLIALLHLRESDADFRTYLGNGDPLNRPTTHVPRGRGPFATFEDGAVDALKLDGLSSVRDWRLEKALYYAELFNGAGYHNRGLPSPYIWGGTNIQKPGKYVSDGVWSSRTLDSQPGVAPILKTMMQLDPSIAPIRED